VGPRDRPHLTPQRLRRRLPQPPTASQGGVYPSRRCVLSPDDGQYSAHTCHRMDLGPGPPATPTEANDNHRSAPRGASAHIASRLHLRDGHRPRQEPRIVDRSRPECHAQHRSLTPMPQPSAPARAPDLDAKRTLHNDRQQPTITISRHVCYRSAVVSS